MLSKILSLLQTALITETVVLIKNHQRSLDMIAILQNLSQEKDVAHLLQTDLFEPYWFLPVNPFRQESCSAKVKRWPSNMGFCARLIISSAEWQLPSEWSAGRLIPIEQCVKNGIDLTINSWVGSNIQLLKIRQPFQHIRWALTTGLEESGVCHSVAVRHGIDFLSLMQLSVYSTCCKLCLF